MILDTSALIALVLREPGFEAIEAKLGTANQLMIGAPSLVECGIVLSSKLGRDARTDIQRLLDQLEIEVVPFDRILSDRAVDAFLKFGKGRHPAALNILDCMSHALAAETGLPLLFTGEDFAKTGLPH